MPRKQQFHTGSALRVVPRLHPASVIDGNLLNNGQPQTTAASVGSGARRIASVEALKHLVQIGIAQPLALIPDGKEPPATTRLNLRLHIAPLRCITQCIV